MNAIHRILMSTDGSITAIIEAVTQKKVQVETIEQKIIRADKELAELLEVDEGDEVNYRVVYLKADGEIYAKAISFTPLKRLENSFKEDLMRADIPIGKIMKKHNIEARREIIWSRIENADSKLADELRIADKRVISRNYNIIHRGKILINITEFFPVERFRV
uniref:DUF98 domain-containing protein n=1 Tax=Archaeoglobus fulgidus TaxID=2234 RepID=A0A7C3RBT5_ARCFL